MCISFYFFCFFLLSFFLSFFFFLLCFVFVSSSSSSSFHPPGMDGLTKKSRTRLSPKSDCSYLAMASVSHAPLVILAHSNGHIFLCQIVVFDPNSDSFVFCLFDLFFCLFLFCFFLYLFCLILILFCFVFIFFIAERFAE